MTMTHDSLLNDFLTMRVEPGGVWARLRHPDVWDAFLESLPNELDPPSSPVFADLLTQRGWRSKRAAGNIRVWLGWRFVDTRRARVPGWRSIDELLHAGLTMPLKPEQRLVDEFIETQVATNPEWSGIFHRDLYRVFVRWLATVDDCTPPPQRALTRALENRGWRSKRGTGNARLWIGRRMIKNPASPPAP